MYLPLVLFIHLNCFGLTHHGDVCFLSSAVELNGTSFVVLKNGKNK